MGALRRREATQAMAHLGLSKDHLVFLGYPDHGTLVIWKDHWGKAVPKHSVLTHSTHCPYPDAPKEVWLLGKKLEPHGDKV